MSDVTSADGSSVIEIPWPEVQAWLVNVEFWPGFLVDVQGVRKTSHERYVFRHHDGREVPYVVRLDARDHRFSWHALTGPPCGGSLRLHALNERQTRVVLSLSNQPAGAKAALADMIVLHRPAVDLDLQRLEAQIRGLTPEASGLGQPRRPRQVKARLLGS